MREAPTVSDFFTADDVIQHLQADLEIHFQIEGESMTRDEAAKHFKLRESLLTVREHLINQGERLE